MRIHKNIYIDRILTQCQYIYTRKLGPGAGGCPTDCMGLCGARAGSRVSDGLLSHKERGGGGWSSVILPSNRPRLRRRLPPDSELNYFPLWESRWPETDDKRASGCVEGKYVRGV